MLHITSDLNIQVGEEYLKISSDHNEILVNCSNWSVLRLLQKQSQNFRYGLLDLRNASRAIDQSIILKVSDKHIFKLSQGKLSNVNVPNAALGLLNYLGLKF